MFPIKEERDLNSNQNNNRGKGGGNKRRGSSLHRNALPAGLTVKRQKNLSFQIPASPARLRNGENCQTSRDKGHERI